MSYDGPTTVSKRTVGMVMRLLARHGRPMTITQLSDITGKSYNTVKRALASGGAVYVTGSYPKVFTVPELYEPEKVLGDHVETVAVPLIEEKAWVGRWNGASHRFAKGIADLQIKSDSDPKQLLEEFTRGASSLASVAYALQQVKDAPDWFTQLGGSDGE